MPRLSKESNRVCESVGGVRQEDGVEEGVGEGGGVL